MITRVSVRKAAVATIAAGVLAACGGNDGAMHAGGDVGERLYQAHCASCHGVDLRGTDQGPSQLSVVYEPGHHSDDTYRAAVRQGSSQHHWDFGPMLPVEGLTDDEVDLVIAYIRSVQEREGFESYPPR